MGQQTNDDIIKKSTAPVKNKYTLTNRQKRERGHAQKQTVHGHTECTRNYMKIKSIKLCWRRRNGCHQSKTESQALKEGSDHSIVYSFTVQIGEQHKKVVKSHQKLQWVDLDCSYVLQKSIWKYKTKTELTEIKVGGTGFPQLICVLSRLGILKGRESEV